MNFDEIMSLLREGDEGTYLTPEAERRVLALRDALAKHLVRVDVCSVVCDGAAMLEQHESTERPREVRILLVKANGDAFVSRFVGGERVEHYDIPFE